MIVNLTLMMTSAQVFETSVNVITKIFLVLLRTTLTQDGHNLPTYMTPRFKPFTVLLIVHVTNQIIGYF